jgi:dTDP-4-amino-4,6-dideoxygalactose transaminase
MSNETIPLCDPDLTVKEIESVTSALRLTRLSGGDLVGWFEEAFAQAVGRKHAVAVASGTMGLLLALKAQGIGPGDEVILPSYSWRCLGHAVVLAGAWPVFVDIDYWSGTINPMVIEQRMTERTRAIIATDVNGHPAPWEPLRALADEHGLILIEDASEAIGSTYKGTAVGGFGLCAVFDFSHPAAITCGEGGMVVTDDDRLANLLRHMRCHRPEERASVVVGAFPAWQAGMSEVTAALGLAQLRRLDEILAHRRHIAQLYFTHIKSFEGIKDPYIAPDATDVHWLLYVVHLGTRFTRSSRDAIIEDLRNAGIEASAYSQPLHLQRYYIEHGYRRGELPVTERVADRAVALPLHRHLSEDQIAFIVSTMKDASINVGAGAAIYL